MQYQAHTGKLSMVLGAKTLLSEESTPEDSSLVDGGWTHVFAGPEALLESLRWRKLLLNS